MHFLQENLQLFLTNNTLLVFWYSTKTIVKRHNSSQTVQALCFSHTTGTYFPEMDQLPNQSVALPWKDWHFLIKTLIFFVKTLKSSINRKDCHFPQKKHPSLKKKRGTVGFSIHLSKRPIKNRKNEGKSWSETNQRLGFESGYPDSNPNLFHKGMKRNPTDHQLITILDSCLCNIDVIFM